MSQLLAPRLKILYMLIYLNSNSDWSFELAPESILNLLNGWVDSTAMPKVSDFSDY
jgi:hypothetical protein